MNKDVELSRLRISRRRALALGGTVSLTGLLAACSGGGSSTTAATASSVSGSSGASGVSGASGSLATGTVDEQLLALLDQAPRCVLAVEETQGPYWFDVDSIRSDIREDRPGLELNLAMRVQDLTNCSADGTAGAVANAVVEIWHCDAGGVYSGFESGSVAANQGGGMGGGMGGPPPGGTPPEGMPEGGPGGPGGQPPQGGMGGPGGPGGMGGSGETSDGSYSVGDQEATTTDDGTYLRGAQTTDANGIARFTTIFPGWYTGRTVHIHLKVHIDKKTVLTTQLYFDDALNDDVFSTVPPYTDHTGRDTRNDTDGIYDAAGLMATSRQPDRMLAAINLGIDV
ncbi:protocatechuate dioxygenase [Rhodococcus hoagii]|uniref:protocatechuate dioxygenase n=1 Tax=Rhodococcus hoagii TaxID=43767 RepID=UPI0009BDD50D|nr:protocatechuate dioxygenase [Prescottella equi]NKR32041.1 protocatechuate dioxygenase [Prescottella equi]NKS59138.1 protocatechuate dioxygenase [Prescottella equi]NKS70817.1 protocatechuate dioxygenase [Prescottella equi]NKS82593.1 protocatechuate dioxygenase [Prescottella equi]OQQ37673.1 protocatechuate dioxygenase [Prescottella equi]